MSIEYREVTMHDIPQLAKIRAAEWESDEYWMWRISGYLNRELHPQLALIPRVLYLAADNNIIVGFVAGHLTQRFGCDGELEWINVILSYRRQGIARKLVKLLANWFIQNKARRICVDGSGPFYEKLGAAQLNEHWMIWNDIGQVSSANADS